MSPQLLDGGNIDSGPVSPAPLSPGAQWIQPGMGAPCPHLLPCLESPHSVEIREPGVLRYLAGHIQHLPLHRERGGAGPAATPHPYPVPTPSPARGGRAQSPSPLLQQFAARPHQPRRLRAPITASITVPEAAEGKRRERAGLEQSAPWTG